MRSILVPSDFSTNAATALKQAIYISQQTDAAITVYHCSHLSGVGVTMPVIGSEPLLENLVVEDEAGKLNQLKQHVKEVYQSMGINEIPAGTQCVVELNPMPVEAIITYAEKENADMIVLGTHGSSGLEKFFFGSNTSNIISKSKTPVLAIPETANGQAIKKVCFCSDLENIKAELDQLMPVINSLNATLDILYFDYGKDPQHSLPNNAKALISDSAYSNVQLIEQHATLELSLVNQIKNYLTANKPDCIVMFTKERSLWDKLFLGSKTEDMSASLQVPLLSFKKK